MFNTFIQIVNIFLSNQYNEIPKWKQTAQSKVNSLENIKYKPNGAGYRVRYYYLNQIDITNLHINIYLQIYNEKVKWNSDSRIKSIMYAESMEQQRQQRQQHRFHVN